MSNAFREEEMKNKVLLIENGEEWVRDWYISFNGKDRILKKRAPIKNVFMKGEVVMALTS